jgi:fatty-acyl-CoA synthase
MPDYGVGSWPHRRARIRPASVALRQEGRALSYADLADRVERLARSLAARGVRHGDRIVYLGPNDVATFEVFFAAGRLGAIFVPLNIRLTPPEIRRLLVDTGPTAVFYAPAQRELAAQADPETLILPIDERTGLIDAGRDLPPATTDVGLDDDAVILYTSGTTGRPKGAVLTHGNLTFNVMNQLAHADVLGTDTALCTAPLFHAAGLGQVSLPTLFKGGTVAVVPGFDAGAVLAAITELGIASFSAVPTMLQLLCDHPDFHRTDLSSLRYVIYGGSMVVERVARAWQERGVDILQGYGMTEAAPGVCLAIPDGAAERPTSIGVPHFFTDIEVDAGELLVRGLNVFRGYWRRSEEALPSGWFHSGDVVRIDEDGWAYAVDRIKDVLISGGENVYPAEVEAIVLTLAGITDCAVIGVPDERWGEAGLAYVVATPGTWTEQSLRDALRERLAPFKIPKHVRFVDSLPRTVTGKVIKQVLRDAQKE